MWANCHLCASFTENLCYFCVGAFELVRACPPWNDPFDECSQCQVHFTCPLISGFARGLCRGCTKMRMPSSRIDSVAIGPGRKSPLE